MSWEADRRDGLREDSNANTANDSVFSFLVYISVTDQKRESIVLTELHVS